MLFSQNRHFSPLLLAFIISAYAGKTLKFSLVANFFALFTVKSANFSLLSAKTLVVYSFSRIKKASAIKPTRLIKPNKHGRFSGMRYVFGTSAIG